MKSWKGCANSSPAVGTVNLRTVSHLIILLSHSVSLSGPYLSIRPLESLLFLLITYSNDVVSSCCDEEGIHADSVHFTLCEAFTILSFFFQPQSIYYVSMAGYAGLRQAVLCCPLSFLQPDSLFTQSGLFLKYI